jgi:hypothetical protein
MGGGVDRMKATHSLEAVLLPVIEFGGWQSQAFVASC